MKFEIPKGKPFYCEFAIKEPGSSVPMDLTGATGTFTLITIGTDACIAIPATPMTVTDPTNGKMAVSLTSEQTDDLVSRRAFAEDGYPSIATYRAGLDITASEPIYVDIPKVYVLDDGAGCVV